MKKATLVMIIICCFIAGCSVQGDPDGSGYILEISENRVLVLDQKFEDKGWNEIYEEYNGSAVWLKTDVSNLKPGQKISYWIKGDIRESYPSQADAKKVKVLEN